MIYIAHVPGGVRHFKRFFVERTFWPRFCMFHNISPHFVLLIDDCTNIANNKCIEVFTIVHGKVTSFRDDLKLNKQNQKWMKIKYSNFYVHNINTSIGAVITFENVNSPLIKTLLWLIFAKVLLKCTGLFSLPGHDGMLCLVIFVGWKLWQSMQMKVFEIKINKNVLRMQTVLFTAIVHVIATK